MNKTVFTYKKSGVNIDADESGLNGFYVSLWCSESRGDDWCGTAGADYQEMKKLKDDEQWICNELSMEVDHMTCENLRIIDEKIHQINGYRAFTITVSASLTNDGNLPYYPQIEAGTYKSVGTTTYVLVENDIWVIASSTSPPQNFDAELDQKIISTFLENFNKIDYLVDYFDKYRENLVKKTLNSYLKSVSNP